MQHIAQTRAAARALAFKFAPGIAARVQWLNDALIPGLSVVAAAGNGGLAIRGTAGTSGTLLISINDRTVRMDVAGGDTAAAVARALDTAVRAGLPTLAAPASLARDDVQVVHFCRLSDVVGSALTPPVATPEASEGSVFGNMKSDGIERELRRRFPTGASTVASIKEAFVLLMDNGISILDPGVMRFVTEAIPQAIKHALTSDVSYGRSSVDRLKRVVVEELASAPTDATDDERKKLLDPFTA